MIRDLVFHLPAMVTPRWVHSRSQPIALDDVLEYLVRVPDLAEAAGAVYDVGGPEVLTYAQMMRDFGATWRMRSMTLLKSAKTVSADLPPAMSLSPAYRTTVWGLYGVTMRSR